MNAPATSASRLHSHRGATRPHPVTLKHANVEALGPHGTELRRWARRLGRPGKSARDQAWAERRTGEATQ